MKAFTVPAEVELHAHESVRVHRRDVRQLRFSSDVSQQQTSTHTLRKKCTKRPPRRAPPPPPPPPPP
eukprot:COSAG01_NODE_12222_length_1777_cov_5.624553_1_plen_66_part_10